jgi:hypothetical protein
VSHNLRHLGGRWGVAAALGADDAVDDGHAHAGEVAELDAVEDVLAGGMLRLSMMTKSATRPTSMMPQSSARILAVLPVAK